MALLSVATTFISSLLALLGICLWAHELRGSTQHSLSLVHSFVPHSPAFAHSLIPPPRFLAFAVCPLAAGALAVPVSKGQLAILKPFIVQFAVSANPIAFAILLFLRFH